MLSGLSVGIYTIYDSLTTINGCDSIFELTLTVNSGYLLETHASICDNESYLWHDTLISGLTYGIYTINDSLISINGCDSVYRLTLMVNPTYLIEEQYSICENEGYMWRGIPLSGLTAGSYIFYDSLITTFGCDSVYRLTLTVNRSYLFQERAAICAGENYNWHGMTISGLSAGTHIYHIYFSTREGCDSIFRLVLTVNNGYLFLSDASIVSNDE